MVALSILAGFSGFGMFGRRDTEASSPASPAAAAPESRGQRTSKRLGEMLVQEGVVSPAQLDEALALKKEKGGFLGAILVELNYLDQDTLISFLVKQCRIPHLSLLDYHISEDVLTLIPKETCLKHGLLPIDKLGRILTVAMTDPLDLDALEEIRDACPDLRIKPILCSPQHFQAVASRCFEVKPAASATVSASTFGLPGSPPASATPPETPAQPDASDEEALDAAVESLMREAEEAPPPIASPPPAAATPPAVAAPPLEPRSVSPEPAAAAPPPSPAPTAPPSQAPPPDAGELARAVRDSVSEGVREALTPLLERLLAGEADTVAELARRDLTPPKRRHASVTAFGHSPLGDAGQEVLDHDERVAWALESPRPLTGFTFDAFLPGAANAFTFSLAQDVAAQPGGDCNPFFLYGGVGLGKTHLINAVGNAVLARDAKARVGYVSSSRFASALLEAVQDHAAEEFRRHYCCWDVLILDDIQFLGGRVQAQEEFFHIFNALQHEGRQVILAADKAPDRLGLLEERLVSRFAGGIVTDVKPPEYETRLEILRRHMAATRENAPEEVLAMIAMRVPHDMRKMTGALRKVAAFARHAGKALSCDMAAEVLRHLGAEEAA